MTVGRQIAEAVRLHGGATKEQALERAVEVLTWSGCHGPRSESPSTRTSSPAGCGSG